MSVKTVCLASILLLFLAVSVPAEKKSADFTDPVTGMEFIFIKGGKFDMGDIRNKDRHAVPAHKVAVSDFYLAKYEVTFAQYDLFCEKTGRKKAADEGWGRGNRPVINVSWKDATAFAAWLSKQTGKSFRLPSEAEWEYAARGKRSAPFWWGHELSAGMANCRDCGSEWDYKQTAPVGSFPANPFGIHDMNGNVYEWCADMHNDTYENAPVDGSPWLTGRKDSRITRGGSWYQHGSEIRSFARCWDRENDHFRDVGFRLALDP